MERCQPLSSQPCLGKEGRRTGGRRVEETLSVNFRFRRSVSKSLQKGCHLEPVGKSFEGQKKSRTTAIRPASAGHLQHFIKGKRHPLFTLPETHIPHVSLFSAINISARPDRSLSPSILFFLSPLPPGGHFVCVNHTVTLRIPKMALVSIYST